MWLVDLDVVMLDAPFGDAGRVNARLTVDGASAHAAAAGALPEDAGRWTCADILQAEPGAESGVYSIKLAICVWS